MKVSLLRHTSFMHFFNCFNCSAEDVSNWTKMEVLLKAKGTDPNARLELTTTKNGVIWFDQVSLMPLDTFKVCISM